MDKLNDQIWPIMDNHGKERHYAYDLYTKYNINRTQVHRLKHNMNVQTNTLDRLCNILDCDIEEIIEHIPDDNMF